MKIEDGSFILDEHSGGATFPTLRTRFSRRCVLFQMLRFAIINLKMIRVIFRSHS